MDVTIEEIGPCKKKLTVSVPPERIKEELDKSYRELGDTAVVHGFRRGRVPRALLERRFGKQLVEDVRESLLENSLQEAVKEHALAPLGHPQFEQVEFDPAVKLSYQAVVDVRPVFELCDYQEIEVERPAIDTAEYSDAKVDGVVEHMRRSRGELTIKEAPAAEGDFLSAAVTIGPTDKPIFHKDTATISVDEGMVLGLSVPDLKRASDGAQEGTTLKFTVDLPADFPVAEHAGATVPLQLDVQDVLELELPALDADFARGFDFETVEELRAEVRRNLQSAREREREEALGDQVVKQLVDRIGFELPDDLVRHELEHHLQRRRFQLGYQGRSTEEIDSALQAEERQSRENTLRALKAFFIFDEIAKKEKIYALESDVDERITRLATREGVSAAHKRQELEQKEELAQLRHQIMEEKVRAFLMEKVKIRDGK